MSAAAVVDVAAALTPARLRALEEVASELKVEAWRVLRRLIDHERWSVTEDTTWVPAYRPSTFRSARRPRPFKDGTLWPADADPGRLRAFWWRVRREVGLGHSFNAHGGAWWSCHACGASWPLAPGPLERRAWWVCPKKACNSTPLDHRIVAYLWRHYFAGGPAAPKVDELALERQDLAVLADVDVLDGAAAKGRFRCRACRSKWASDLMTWWRCPRGCNVSPASERRMLRAYSRRGSYLSKEGWWCRRPAAQERWRERYRLRAWRATLAADAL